MSHKSHLANIFVTPLRRWLTCPAWWHIYIFHLFGVNTTLNCTCCSNYSINGLWSRNRSCICLCLWFDKAWAMGWTFNSTQLNEWKLSHLMIFIISLKPPILSIWARSNCRNLLGFLCHDEDLKCLQLMHEICHAWKISDETQCEALKFQEISCSIKKAQVKRKMYVNTNSE